MHLAIPMNDGKIVFAVPAHGVILLRISAVDNSV